MRSWGPGGDLFFLLFFAVGGGACVCECIRSKEGSYHSVYKIIGGGREGAFRVWGWEDDGDNKQERQAEKRKPSLLRFVLGGKNGEAEGGWRRGKELEVSYKICCLLIDNP